MGNQNKGVFFKISGKRFASSFRVQLEQCGGLRAPPYDPFNEDISVVCSVADHSELISDRFKGTVYEIDSRKTASSNTPPAPCVNDPSS